MVLCVLLAAALPAGLGAQEDTRKAAPVRQACPRPERVMPHHSPAMLRRELGKLGVERQWARRGPRPRGSPRGDVDPNTARARYLRATAAHREAMAHLRRGCRYVPNLVLAASAVPADSAPGATLMLDVVYYYTGDHGSEVSIGAITTLDTRSTGHWAFRPVRLAPGLHTARIRLGMNDAGPDTYHSDGVNVSMYVHRASDFAERDFPLERAWHRER